MSDIVGIASGADLSEPVSVILKIIGLGYLFGISADICRELGEGGIAKALEVAGRVEIILLSVPDLIKTLNLGVGLIEG
jgi:stage III sporulation protein AD